MKKKIKIHVKADKYQKQQHGAQILQKQAEGGSECVLHDYAIPGIEEVLHLCPSDHLLVSTGSSCYSLSSFTKNMFPC